MEVIQATEYRGDNMPYNPFQMMMLEMLLGQLQQQGNPFGGAMGYGGGGFGGQQGIARGMSPTRGIPGGLGVSPFMPSMFSIRVSL